jgi:gluconate 2-dehydrogenase gamma chain
MQRREVLKILAAGAALPAFSPSLMAFFQEAQAQVGTSYKPRTLNPQQDATVVAMIDLIIPATDTPGAKTARVNDFIDVILTEWATDSERQDFLNGLAGVDKQSNDLYGKNFVDASPEQQTTLLRAMDDVIMGAHIERHRRHGNTVPEERDKQLRDSFWYVFKGITLHGYYTSEIGFSQELNQQIIPGAFHGCVPLAVGKRA